MVKSFSTHDTKEMLEDYFQKGEMFNLETLFSRRPGDVETAAIVQMTAVKRIPIQTFRSAMQQNVSLYKEVLDSYSATLQRTQERLRRMTLLNSSQRVVNFLGSHTLRYGRKVGFEWVVKPIITHHELGNIAGTGRQTVTTVLNELRSKGIIHFNRSYLIVRDMEALLKLVD